MISSVFFLLLLLFHIERHQSFLVLKHLKIFLSVVHPFEFEFPHLYCKLKHTWLFFIISWNCFIFIQINIGILKLSKKNYCRILYYSCNTSFLYWWLHWAYNDIIKLIYIFESNESLGLISIKINSFIKHKFNSSCTGLKFQQFYKVFLFLFYLFLMAALTQDHRASKRKYNK